MKNSLLILLCGIIIFGITGCGTNPNEKMTKYLESIEYSCSFDDAENEYICNRTKGIKKELMIINKFSNNYEYIVESKNEYKMSVNSYKYRPRAHSDELYITVTNLLNEDYECYYVPTSFEGNFYDFSLEGNQWKIGDTSKGYGENRNGTLGYDDDCRYDFSDKVDNMLREFESYFKNSGVELQ